MTIRYASSEEIENLEWVSLWNEDNDGDDILVVEAQGQIVAWAQVTGSTIYFVESIGGGAGTALVDHLKAEYGYLVADNVKGDSAGYWAKMGFQPQTSRSWSGSKNWEWEAEE